MDLEKIKYYLETDTTDNWIDYLTYCRRYNRYPTKYEVYLKTLGFDYKITDSFWSISTLTDLSIFSACYAENLRELSVSGRLIRSIEGIDRIICPNLESISIKRCPNLAIISFPRVSSISGLTISESKIPTHHIHSDSIKRIIFYKCTIPDCRSIYNLTELIELDLSSSKVEIPPRLSHFPNLRILNIQNTSSVEIQKLGPSESLEYFSCSLRLRDSLKDCIDRGWYPNLDYPFKGQNKQ